jgi:hypothetical protein
MYGQICDPSPANPHRGPAFFYESFRVEFLLLHIHHSKDHSPRSLNPLVIGTLCFGRRATVGRDMRSVLTLSYYLLSCSLPPFDQR